MLKPIPNQTTLSSKGGIMLFTIERPDRLYKGIILLSPAKGDHHNRIICMREYRHSNLSGL